MVFNPRAAPFNPTEKSCAVEITSPEVVPEKAMRYSPELLEALRFRFAIQIFKPHT